MIGADALKGMREAGKRLAEVSEILKEHISPGVTGRELDEIAEREIKKRNSIPAFKGYGGFPATICFSVNEVVIHGIPGDKPLLPGDIVSIDIGLSYKGWYADMAFTMPVGKVSEEKRRLMDVTEKALYKAISIVREGVYTGDIGEVVEKTVKGAGFCVLRDYTGHGIGRKLHMEPPIFNYGQKGTGPRLKAGQFIAIEPMVVAYEDCTVKVADDGWTVYSIYKKPSAHFEHTIAILKDGYEIMTKI